MHASVGYLPQSTAAAFPVQHRSLQAGGVTTCSGWHAAKGADATAEPTLASPAAARAPHSLNVLLSVLRVDVRTVDLMAG